MDVAGSTQLAVLLRAGALPAKLTFLEERTIGPELGQDSIDAGKLGSIVAIVAVVAYIVASYGLFGVFASVAVIVNVILLVVGAFLDTIAAISILVPILMPVAARYGIDPVHFGIMMIFNLSIGAITPPFGTTMFLTCNLTGVKIDEYMKEILPFYVALGVTLMVTTFYPPLSLALANL